MWTSQAWSIYNTVVCLNHIHTVYITRVASTASMLHLYIPIPEIPTKLAMHVSRTHKHTTHTYTICIRIRMYAQIEAQASILFQPFAPTSNSSPTSMNSIMYYCMNYRCCISFWMLYHCPTLSLLHKCSLLLHGT